jgi:hypothetical protein
MKKFIFGFITLFAVGIGTVFAADNIYFSYCSEPITYSEGTIDSRYEMDRSELKQVLIESGDIWNNAYGQKLFMYDPQSSLKVNLIYDERSGLLEQISSSGQTIAERKETLESEYKKYEIQKAELEDRIKVLNLEIEKLVKDGGITEKIYNDLISRQKTLESDITELNKAADRINSETAKINSFIDSLNANVDSFNSLLEYKPEEGIYDPVLNKIDIFFFKDNAELTHTIAHELGHSLGVEHVQGDNSLMNEVVNDALTLSNQDTDALNEQCKSRNVFETVSEQVQKYNYKPLTQVLDMF